MVVIRMRYIQEMVSKISDKIVETSHCTQIG